MRQRHIQTLARLQHQLEVFEHLVHGECRCKVARPKGQGKLLGLGFDDGRTHRAARQDLPHLGPIQPAFAPQGEAFSEHGRGLHNEQIDHQFHQPALLGLAQVKELGAPRRKNLTTGFKTPLGSRDHDGEIRRLCHVVVARDTHPQILDTVRFERQSHRFRRTHRHRAGVHVNAPSTGMACHPLRHRHKGRVMGQRGHDQIARLGSRQEVLAPHQAPGLSQGLSGLVHIVHLHLKARPQSRDMLGHGQTHFTDTEEKNVLHQIPNAISWL